MRGQKKFSGRKHVCLHYMCVKFIPVKNVSDIPIFRRIHFKKCQHFTKPHRLPFLKKPSFRIILSLRLIRSDGRYRFNRSGKSRIHLRFLVFPPSRLPVFGMHSRYFESALPPVWSWYPFMSIPFPSFMATCKHYSYARKMWERPFLLALHSCGNINRRFNATLFVPAPKSSIHQFFTLQIANLKRYYFNTFSGSNQFCGLPRQQGRFR